MAGHRRGQSRRRRRDGNGRAGRPFAWTSVTKLLVALAAGLCLAEELGQR